MLTSINPTTKHTPITQPVKGLASPGSVAAERFQGLRLKLERLQQSRSLKVIAVTSPGVNDGKTNTSVNLAGALAHGSSARVLLIDADLRRPSVATHLGIGTTSDIGLAEALTDPTIGFEKIARPVNSSSAFWVIPAGDASASVHELLRSPRFAQLLNEARERFDFVILDTPPLVPVCDAAVLSRMVDGVLIVVAADETPRKLLESALGLIDEPKVLGIVFNGDNSTIGKYDVYARSYAAHS